MDVDAEVEVEAAEPDGGLLGDGFGGDQAEVALTAEERALDSGVVGMDADDFEVGGMGVCVYMCVSESVCICVTAEERALDSGVVGMDADDFEVGGMGVCVCV